MRPVHPDRRTFLTLGVGALVVATLPASLRRPRSLVRRRIPVMGSVAEVALPGPDGTSAQRAIDAAFAALRRVEAAMTRFRPDSDVGRVNLAGTRWHPVSMESAAVLDEARFWADVTDGRFDPCLGRASALWDATTRSRPPSAGERAELGEAMLWTDLEVERRHDGARARLAHPQASIDLGGIAKGYGVDAAADALRANGYRDGLVNVGGDLYALGVDVSGHPWRIGIRSPRSADEIVGVVDVAEAAVATSGDYVRFFSHRGRRYHHLLDPRTREPLQTSTRSLTLRARRCIDADAAATALFAATPTQAEAIVRLSGRDARIVHRIQEMSS